MKENRKSPRYEINQLINVSYGKEEFIKASGINISETGLLCEIASSVEVHARIYLLLTDAKGNHPIELEGIVIRVEKKGKKLLAGIEFDEPAASVKGDIKRLVKGLKRG